MKKLLLSLFITWILCSSFIQAFASDENNWMLEQIHSDFAYFREQVSISKDRIIELTSDQKYENLLLVRFSIKNNQINVIQNFSYNESRVQVFLIALQKLSKTYTLPDIEFIITMHDGFGAALDVPIFAMSKRRDNNHVILLPDFDALQAKYQVLKGNDITKNFVSWEKKNNQLIWRGSTAQCPYDEGLYLLNADNIYSFSRIILCELSQQFPRIIDAKFTLYAQGGEKIPYLKKFQGKHTSYENQLYYKYHILIDGNTCPFSASGWKFFANSLIFKPDSPYIQWYYNELKPFQHYVPVKANLEDLLEKLEWANIHDDEARIIAKNAREFAINNITKERNLYYFYLMLLEYSKLNIY